jgi:hypothetical protein
MLFLIASTCVSTHLAAKGGSESGGRMLVKTPEGYVYSVPPCALLCEGGEPVSVSVNSRELDMMVRWWQGRDIVCTLEELVRLTWAAQFFLCEEFQLAIEGAV